MKCDSCGFENAVGVKFCSECGVNLGTRAPGGGTASGAGVLAGTPAYGTLGDAPEMAADGVQYEVLEELGRGGMAVVYRARDRKLQRDVALKRILPDFSMSEKASARLLGEARSMANIQHFNIVHVYDFGSDAQGPFVAMELILGKKGKPYSLEDRVKDGGPVSERDAATLVAQLCRGVAHAHARGIVHRDIKPSNVLLTETGEPKLTDFGIAHMDEAVAGFTVADLTVEGVSLGTPAYMAPEQATDATMVDARADVYSLGGVLYFCLTGESPRYYRETKLPPRMRAVVSKALECDRDLRWQSAQEFANALSAKMPAKSVSGKGDDENACPECGDENPATARYCQKCGGILVRSCPRCQKENRASIEYCGQCGMNVRRHFQVTDLLKAAGECAEDGDAYGELELLQQALDLDGNQRQALQRSKELERQIAQLEILMNESEVARTEAELRGAIEKWNTFSKGIPKNKEAPRYLPKLDVKLRAIIAEKAFLRGTESLRSARFEDAVEAFREALDAVPAHEGAKASLAEAETCLAEVDECRRVAAQFWNDGHLPKARELYRTIVQRCPHDAAATRTIETITADMRTAEELLDAGRRQFHEKRYEEAIAALEECVRLYAMLTMAHQFLEQARAKMAPVSGLVEKGLENERKGNCIGARDAFSKALEITPYCQPASEGLERIRRRLRRRKAIRAAIAACAMLALLSWMSYSAVMAVRYRSAVRTGEEALSKGGWREALEWTARAKRIKPDGTRALELETKSKQSGAEALAAEGAEAFKRDDWAGAGEKAAAALELSPEFAPAQHVRSQVTAAEDGLKKAQEEARAGKEKAETLSAAEYARQPFIEAMASEKAAESLGHSAAATATYAEATSLYEKAYDEAVKQGDAIVAAARKAAEDAAQQARTAEIENYAADELLDGANLMMQAVEEKANFPTAKRLYDQAVAKYVEAVQVTPARKQQEEAMQAAARSAEQSAQQAQTPEVKQLASNELAVADALLVSAKAEKDFGKATELYKQAADKYAGLPELAKGKRAEATGRGASGTVAAPSTSQPSGQEPGEIRSFGDAEFAWIPAGTFEMGDNRSPAELANAFGGEATAYENEKPRHSVTLSRGFWMGRYEVTNQEFETFSRNTGYRTEAEMEGWSWFWNEANDTWEKQNGLTWRNPGWPPDGKKPVVAVSWNDALAYCAWLSRELHTTFRLPSEAEWEYACRAGSTTEFQWGDSAASGSGWLNAADVTRSPGAYPWKEHFGFNDGNYTVAPVGSYKPNPWGLHDMPGNVQEWCLDWQGDYSSGTSTDPNGPGSGNRKIVRGGSWRDGPRMCRSAYRDGSKPVSRCDSVGFRLVVDNTAQPSAANNASTSGGDDSRQASIDDAGKALNTAIRTGSTKDFLRESVYNRLNLWKQAAEEEVPEALWLLGCCYENGIGVYNISNEQAFQCYLKAADKGYGPALNDVGLCYKDGKGTGKDLARAVDYFQRAARVDRPGAWYNLGVFYEEGLGGLSKDTNRSVECYRKAGTLGYKLANEALARLGQ